MRGLGTRAQGRHMPVACHAPPSKSLKFKRHHSGGTKSAENLRWRRHMHWEALLTIEIVLTVAAVWLGHYSWTCALLALLRTTAVILASLAGSR